MKERERERERGRDEVEVEEVTGWGRGCHHAKARHSKSLILYGVVLYITDIQYVQVQNLFICLPT